MQAMPKADSVKQQARYRKGSARSRVLIVDDHPLVREGLAARISAQPDLRVCGEAADVEEALALVESTKPAVVIIDLTLKNSHGLELIRKLAESGRDVKMLVLSAHDESLFAERALRAGAHGYVSKQEAQGEVIDAIRAVLRGERYLSGEMTQRLVTRAIDPRPAPEGVQRLTDRELEIFTLIGRGEGTRAIADLLQLSVHTIETHRENIRGKLNLKNGAQLVQRAVRWVVETDQ